MNKHETTFYLYHSMFGDHEHTMVESGPFAASAFRFESGVCGLRLKNDLGELGGVVKTQLWLAEHILPQIVAVNSARALVFANGRIKKKLVEPTLAERGFAFGDSDIADAYVIAEAVRLQARRSTHENGSDGAGGEHGQGGTGKSTRHPRKRK